MVGPLLPPYQPGGPRYEPVEPPPPPPPRPRIPPPDWAAINAELERVAADEPADRIDAS